jgi:CheY-like chemotaxis protein
MAKKILVIDDEEILTKSFSMLLEKSGYETYTAKNGQDAEILIESEDINLVICDIRMPGKNGIETVGAIKKLLKRQGRDDVPVVFMTGFADEELEKQAGKLRPLSYLLKPFDSIQLLKIIQQQIGK